MPARGWQPNLVKQVRWHIEDFSEFGVPILSNDRVAQIANVVLTRLDPVVLLRPGQTDVAGMLKHLQDHHGATVIFEDLGEHDTCKVLGKTVFSTRQIVLDRSLLDGHPAYRFVAAHEVGHWLLHQWRPIRRSPDDQRIAEMIDTEDEVFAVRAHDDRPEPIRHLERQANHFAACLVLPESSFIRALIEMQLERGINQRVGMVWVNNANVDECRTIRDELASLFGVSKSAVRVRLDSLERLVDDGHRINPGSGDWHRLGRSR